MSECSNGVRPSFMGLVIQTSDVTLYDGANLSCLAIAPGASLNDIIVAIDTAICASVVPTTFNATAISYSGDTSFGCFTITGNNAETIIEELATEICTVNTALEALTLNDITLGAGLTSTCLGNYASGVNPINVLQDILDELCDNSTAITTLESQYLGPDPLLGLTGGNDFVISGGGKSTAGLFISMAPSGYFVDGKSYTKSGVSNIALTATADNYVDWDSASENYVITPVAISDPAPAIAAGYIRLWNLSTNGIAVTNSEDLREYGWVSDALLLDDAVTTAKIANTSVTGAKLETLGVGAIIGDSDLFTITYDTKGRVTASSFNIDLTGLAANDVLQYDGAQWVPAAISSIGGSGTNGRVARFTAAATVADSLFRDNGTTQGLNAAVSATIQFNVATTLAYGQYLTNSGSNADQYGYYATVSGSSSVDVGAYFEANGALAGLAPAGSYIGLIGTSATLNAREAYGARFGVDGDIASSGDCVAIYGYANNDGSGAEIGLMIEKGQSIFGSSATPDDSALVQLDSTTQGFRFSRMTTVERNAIASPAAGLVVYNTTTNKLNLYTTTWEVITSA